MKVEAKQPKILFTRDGQPLPSPIPIPPGANDLAFGFDKFDELPPPKTAPPGANDFEFFWHEGRIVEAWWTADGERIEPMPLSPSDYAVHALLGTDPVGK